MKVKVTRISQIENRVLYDGPAIKHDYPISDFFELVAQSRSEGEGVIFRFGFINTEREKIQIECTLSYAETVDAHKSLVGWLKSIIDEFEGTLKSEGAK